MTPLYYRFTLFTGVFIFFIFISMSTFHRDTRQKVSTTFQNTVDKVKGVKHERLAYATFLADTVAAARNITVTADTFEHDEYFTAARLLGYHILHKPSTRSPNKIPYVVLVTKNTPEIKRERLRRDGAIVVPVDPVETGSWFHPTSWRWNEVMTKLRLWELTQFDRVVFLDVDSVLTKPLDGVFEDPGAGPRKIVKNPTSPFDPENETPLPEEFLFATIPEAYKRHEFPPKDKDFWHGHDYFNAGFFMFTPSQMLYNHYVSLMKPVNGTQLKWKVYFPEQNLLNYAHRRDGPMPWQDLAVTWNIIRATHKDVVNGAVSLHTKWWQPEKDMHEWFAKEVALMEGYYEALDESLFEEENGLEVPLRKTVKRWWKRQVHEWTN